jgi:exonuclease VII small subunit
MVTKIATLNNKIYFTMMNAKETLKQVRTLLGFEEEKSVAFETAMLKDGTIVKWEGELSVGTIVMVETAEGDISAPDATHEIEDGTLVTTLDGVVTEIVKPEMETPEVEISVEAEEFATVSHFNEVVESLESKIAQLTASIESLVNERVSHKEAMSKVVELVEKMIDLPSEEPTLKPHAPSKQESQFENLKKFANALKK